MHLARTALALLLAANTLAINTLAAQAPEITTLKVDARIVVLDVTVVDKQGHHVDTLTRDDFTILEDKAPQPIRSFEPPSAHQMPAAPGAVPNLVHSAADLSKIGEAPVTILVLDELNTLFADMSFGRNALVKYLQSQPPVLLQPTTLLYATNSKFVQLRDYTQDRDQLITDIRKHIPEYPWRMMTGKQGPAAVERMAQTLSSVEQVAQASTGTIGRKNVIWVGVGFASSNLVGLDPRTADTILAAVRRCTDMMLAARITLYTINPTANTTATLDVQTPDDLAISEDQDGGRPNDGTVQFSTFAPQTGGRAFLSRNDLHNEIAEGIATGSSYYTLSYAPTNHSDDPAKMRSIRIVMKDPNLHATTRDGYYPTLAPATPTAGEPPKQERSQIQLDLSNAVTSTISYNGLKVRAAKSGAGYTITVDGGAASSSISWRTNSAGKTEQAEATVLAAWYGPKDKLLGHTAAELTATRPTGTSTDATFTLPVALTGNPDRLRLIIRDAASGRIGTVDIPKPQ